MAAIPISGARSAWDAFATVFLVLTIARWRDVASLKFWAWLSCLAVTGLALSAFVNGQQLTSMFGPFVSLGGMVGTVLFIQRLYHQNARYAFVAAACLAIGLTFYNVLAPTVMRGINPWKYGVGVCVAIVFLSFAAQTRKTFLELSALAVLGIISLATGTRGMTGTMVIVLVFVISRGVARQRSLAVRIAATMLIAVVAVIATLALGGILVNSSVASSARDRFLMQSAINSNPILAGRIEPPISISAVVAHPVIGAGANPEPTAEIVSRALHIANDLGYTHPDSLVQWWTQDNQIYTHSMVMQYWVVGGVLAALPFIAAIGILVVGMVFALRRRTRIPVLVIFLAVQQLSDTIFAPEVYGATSLLGLSVGMLYATLHTPPEVGQSFSGEVEESPRPRPQFSVAEGLSH